MGKLILFDIDYTLLVGVASHAASFSEAFRNVYGIEASLQGINVSGMTDQEIVIEVLKRKGLAEDQIFAKMPECTQVMVSHFQKNVAQESIRILEGVKELLEELENRHAYLGLITGNLEPIGRAKLNKAGLDKYFTVGGFGSDAVKRADLVRVAIKRAEGKYGRFSLQDIFYFGDTPRDIAAGKEVNVKTIGVATGNYSMEELKATGADFALKNLKNTKQVLLLVGYGC